MSNAAPPPPPEGPQGPGGPGGPAGPGGPPPGYGPPQGPYGAASHGAAPPPQGPDAGVWTIHPQEPIPPKRSKAPVIIGVSLAVALIAGGGAFAFVQADPFNLFTSGPQPAEALPANAVAYAAVDLDPAATQKVDAIRFLNHFPAFSKNVKIRDERDDVRKQLITDALDELDCADVSYDDTIEPWLGHKLGFALLPGDGDEPAPVFAIEVTDAGAADKGLKELNDCASAADGGAGYAFNGDYVVLAETQDIADSAVAGAGDSSLAEDDDFSSDMGSLGDLGIVTGWMDVGEMVSLAPTGEFGDTDELAPLTDVAGRYAATFRFHNDSVELATSVYGDYAPIDAGSNPVVDLPASTAFAVSSSGGAKQLDANWDKLMKNAEKSGVDVEQEIADFESETGFAVPEDLQTLLGDNLLMAIDSEGMSAQAVQEGDLDQLNAGIRFTGDGGKLQDLYDRLVSFAGDSFGVELPVSKVDFDNGLAIATNDSYANTLADLDGDLGDSETFQSVVNDAATQDAVMYLDFDAIEDAVVESMQSSGESDDDIANVKPLRAFGISGGYDGEYVKSTARLSVND